MGVYALESCHKTFVFFDRANNCLRHSRSGSVNHDLMVVVLDNDKPYVKFLPPCIDPYDIPLSNNDFEITFLEENKKVAISKNGFICATPFGEKVILVGGGIAI